MCPELIFAQNGFPKDVCSLLGPRHTRRPRRSLRYQPLTLVGPKHTPNAVTAFYRMS